MAIFDKKADQENKETANQKADGVKDSKAAVLTKSKENTGDAYSILLKPLISEKSFRGQSVGKVTFKVNPKANKISIRNAVEKVYDVKVDRVNVITVLGKERKYNGRPGRTSDWKKAIVTLKPGQSIEGAKV